MAAEWNVPFFECSNKQIEELYYFRWWTYRKHIRATPDGFVITEFLPDVPWAGKWNTTSDSAGLHSMKGAGCATANTWMITLCSGSAKGGNPQLYSSWMADALHATALVTGDQQLARILLPDLVANYSKCERHEKRQIERHKYFVAIAEAKLERELVRAGKVKTAAANQTAPDKSPHTGLIAA